METKVSEHVKHNWVERPFEDQKGIFDCVFCKHWTANIEAYKDDVCQARNRRKSGERRGKK